MIKFFHTADIHFGVENYGKIDQKAGINSRFLDFVRSFECCVDQAIEEKIDFFLFAGDAYKTAYPTPTQQKYFMELLFKLYKAQIPVVIVVGNHDHPLSFGKTHALDVFSNLPLSGFHVFSKPKSIVLETKNGFVQIVGIPWPMRHNLLSKDDHRFKDSTEITSYLSSRVGMIIQELAGRLDPKIPAVLVGHLTVSSGIFSGSEKCAVFGTDPIFLPSQLAIKPFDYVALGHLHRHQNLNKDGYPAVVYSGSVERIDFGERKEEKGFCVVELDDSVNIPENRCSYEFVPLETRPMIQIDVTLKKGKNQTEQLLAEIEKHDIAKSIVKIIYHVPEGSSDKVDLLAIQRACALAFHIASITPVRKPVERERRVTLEVSMNFEQIIDKYLTSKEDLKGNEKRLKEKAFQLYREIEGDVEGGVSNIGKELSPRRGLI